MKKTQVFGRCFFSHPRWRIPNFLNQFQASHRRMIYHDLEYLFKAAQVLQSRSWRSNMLVEKKGPRFKFNWNSAKAKHLLIFFCLCVLFFCLGGGGVVVLREQKTYEHWRKMIHISWDNLEMNSAQVIKNINYSPTHCDIFVPARAPLAPYNQHIDLWSITLSFVYMISQQSPSCR